MFLANPPSQRHELEFNQGEQLLSLDLFLVLSSSLPFHPGSARVSLFSSFPRPVLPSYLPSFLGFFFLFNCQHHLISFMLSRARASLDLRVKPPFAVFSSFTPPPSTLSTSRLRPLDNTLPYLSTTGGLKPNIQLMQLPRLSSCHHRPNNP